VTEQQGAIPLKMRRKLLLVFFVLVMIPFLFIGYMAYQNSASTVESTAFDVLLQTGGTLDQHLNFINTTQNYFMASESLQNLMNLQLSSGYDEINFLNEAADLLDSVNVNPEIFRIRLYPIEPSSYPLYMNFMYGSADVESQDWFRQAKERGVPFWKVTKPAENPDLFEEITYSKIKRMYGLELLRASGIVVIDLPLRSLKRYLEPLDRIPGQRIILVNEDGTVLYHSDERRIGSRSLPAEAWKRIRISESGSESIDWEGTRALVSHTTLDGGHWKMISVIPESELYRSANRIGKYTLFFLLFYVVLSFLTVMYITRRFTMPIERLVHFMRKVEDGSFLLKGPTEQRNDEIGLLYRGFNNMVERIHQLIGEIRKSAQKEKEMEYQVLSHQINPHFLYNTLESIRWMAEKHQARDISQVVSDLGNLLRLSLNQGKEITTVRRELEHVQAYANIQKMRMDRQFRIVYLVDEALMDLPFLRLLLQPLIENAIQHGMNETGEEGIIIVKGTRLDEAIRFEIMDDGPGIPEEVIKRLESDAPFETPLAVEGKSSRRGSGVGLYNVHHRLKLYFGGEYGLQVQTGGNGWTNITLLHPILSESADRRQT
jgi:sensor histidine kinase YesM